eukprot:Platyproteum_vivax@DN5530_c0_g1_i1.p1
MATLADSFLQDLEDLEDDIDEDQENLVEEDESDDEIPDAVEMYFDSSVSQTVNISGLGKQQDFLQTMVRVRELKDAAPKYAGATFSEEDEEYILIEKCNNLVGQVDQEIYNIFRFVRDIYSKKFPELESIVVSPVEYIQVVKRIQNETDLTTIDFSDLLSNTAIMAMTVTASTTTGSPLPPSELDKVLAAAEECIGLHECKMDMLVYLESRMIILAPNLSALLGSSLAARLVTKSGGLLNLSRMPAQNIQLIGGSKKAAFGFSSATSGTAVGLLAQSDIVQQVPPAYTRRALRLLGGKSSLAARVDCAHQSLGGEIGNMYREKIINALHKEMEPPPAPMKKALPKPDEKSRARRGGKRYRKMKEKYGTSELRKQANRIQFGPEASAEFRETGKDFGMLGKSTGFGKLRLQHKTNKVSTLPNKRRRIVNDGGTYTAIAPPDASSGLSSSLAFTPLQNMQLVNPANKTNQTAPLTGFDKYFSNAAGFKKG